MTPDPSATLNTGADAQRSSLIGDLGANSASSGADSALAGEDLEASKGNAAASPIMTLVDQILIEALTSGASDIHVEPQEDGLLVRLRHDGVLRSMETLPRTLIPAVTSRFKIMADLDIAERRMPQDGRIRRSFRGRTMDFRVSTLPSRHGEKVVLRLLDSVATKLGLDNLVDRKSTRLNSSHSSVSRMPSSA